MSAFWRDTAGFTIGNESKAAPVAPPDMARFRTTGQKLQISFSGQPYKDLAIVAADIPIDGAFPDGISTELQARGSATTFKRVTYSGTSGANVTLGGVLTIDAATFMDRSIVLTSVVSAPQTTITLTQYQSTAGPVILQMDRARGTAGAGAQNLIDDDPIGRIRFRGHVGGQFTNLGYVQTSWNLNDGGYVEVGAGAAPAKDGPGARLIVTQNIGSGFFTGTGAVPFIIDNTANVRVGLGTLPTTAVAGFLWVPQATGLLTSAPAPNHFGWMPIAFIGDALHTYDGTRWKPLGETTYTAEWRFSTLTSGEPSSGFFRVNHASFASTTALAFHETNNDGVDTTSVWDRLVPGDAIYFQDKDNAANWARYEISGPVVDLGTTRAVPVTVIGANGSISNNQVCSVRVIAGGGGSTGGGSGVTNPGGEIPQIQYKLNATTFGGVANSSVSGAGVKFGGSFVVSNETPTTPADKGFFVNPTIANLTVLMGQTASTPDPILIDMQRSSGVGGAPTNTVKGQYIGRFVFSRYLDAGFPPVGYLHAVWDGDGTTDLGNAVSLGAGAWGASGAQVVIQHKSATSSTVGIFASDSVWFQVSTDGFRYTHGTTGSVYYRDANGYFVSLDIDADPTGGTDVGKVLTVTDVGSGVLLPRWQPTGTGSIRLDQISDPTANKFFNMADYQLAFTYNATEAEECMVIQSATDAPGSGAVLLLRTLGASTGKSPLRIEGRNQFYFSVGVDGKVAIGTETGLANKLTVYHNNTGGTEIGGIQSNIHLGVGNTATSITSGVFSMSDDGNTTALTEMRGLSVLTSRSGAAAANPALITYVIDAAGVFSATTGTGYGLRLKATVGNLANLGTWRGIHIDAPVFVGGGSITTNYAITTAAGAGSIGLGTLTPLAQLHVVGGAQQDQAVGQVLALYKYHGTTGESPTLAFASARGASAGTVAPLQAGDGAGAVIFSGWLSTSYAQYGYVRSFHGGALGNVVEIGAGSLDQSRVQVTQSATAGSVTLVGGGNWWQIQTAGFATNLGGVGAIFYKVAENYIQALEITGTPAAPVYLRSTGTAPAWSALAVGDLAGVVPVVKGGTGTDVAPAAGQLLRAETATNYLPTTLTAGTGIGITNVSGTITITNSAPGSGATPPGGIGTELQYRKADGTAFQAVTGSSVSGANVHMTGFLNVNQEVILNEAPGFVTFRGDAGAKVFGFVRGYDDGEGGGVIDVGVGTPGAGPRLQINEAGAVTTFAGTYYFQVQTGGIDISLGSNGAIYFKSGFLQALAIDASGTRFLKSTGTAPMWAEFAATDIRTGTIAVDRGGTGTSVAPVAGQLLRAESPTAYLPAYLTAGSGIGITNVSGTITITNTTPGSGATPPGGSATQLQFHQTGGTFAGITGTGVSGANIYMTGFLNVNQEVVLNEAPCYVTFRGNAGAKVFGYVRGYDDGGGGGVIDVGTGGAGIGPRLVVVEAGAITMHAGTYYFQVQTGGIDVSIGANGSLFYKSGFMQALAIDATGTKFLKSTGSAPSWTLITADDISGGIIPIARGGTGAGTAPSAGQVLRADGALSYSPATLAAGTGIGIDNVAGTITITNVTPGSGTTPPGGTSPQLQYNNAGAFGGITGSSVSGAHVTLGGNLTLNAGPSVLRFDRLGADAPHGESVGAVQFRGYISGVYAQFGSLYSYWHNTYGPYIVLAAAEAANSRIEIQDHPSISSITLLAGGYYYQVSSLGIRFSIGSSGGLWYQGPTGYLTYVAIGAAGQFLRSDGATPGWASITPTATPPGGVSPQLQFNNAGAFGGVTGTSVSGADIYMTGFLNINQQIALNEAPCFITLRKDATKYWGFIRGYDDGAGGGVIDVGVGTPGSGARLQINEVGAITMLAGSYLFQVQSGGINWSLGSDGAIFFKSGFIQALAIDASGTKFLKSTGSAPSWALITMADLSGILPITQGGTGYGTAPAAGQILRAESGAEYRPATLTAGGGIDITNASGTITIACTVVPGGGALPVGVVGEIQAKNDATSFKALTGSIVSGSDLQIAGHFTINSPAGKTIWLYHTNETVHGTEVGKVQFLGTHGGVYTDFGYLRAYWEDTYGLGAVVEIGHGPGKRVYVASNAITMEFSTHYFQILTTGLRLSGGAQGSIFFQQDYGGYFVYTPLALGSGFLKSNGTQPVWSGIAMADISGIVPIAQGGTGIGTAPTSGKLLIGNVAGGYTLNTLTEDTGIEITEGDGTITIKCTVSPGAGATPPGGSSPQLQYNNAGAFGGITGSSVTGADVTLGGNLKLTRSPLPFMILERPDADVTHGQAVGGISFVGSVSGVPIQFGSLYAYWDSGWGQYIAVVPRQGSNARMELQDNGTDFSATLLVNPGTPTPHFIQVQQNGLRFSTGAPGSLWYQGATFVTAIPISGAGSFLKSDGAVPSWAAITIGDVSGIVPISKGGTGTSSAPASGRLLIGTATGGYAVNKLTADTGIEITEGDGTITIKCTVSPGAGATPPGGSSPQLQFNNAGAFGGVTGTSVSGANISMTGSLNVNQQVILNEAPCYVTFRGDAGTNLYGFVRGYDDGGGGGVIDVGTGTAGSGPRLQINEAGAVTMLAGSYHFQVQTGGVDLSLGSNGAIYFKSGFLQALDIDATGTKFLKSTGSAPAWALITTADITSGILPIVRGGTNNNATPATGQILRANSTSQYAPVTLAGGGTVSIGYDSPSNTLIISGSGGTGSPPGTGTTATPLQYRLDATTFGGISGSSVSGYDITLGGNLIFNSGLATTHIALMRLGSDAVHGTEVGRITFWGRRASVDTDFGFLRSYWDDFVGASPTRVIEIGQSGTMAVRVGAGAAGLFGDSHYVIATNTGIRVSAGSTLQGALFYQNSHGGADLYMDALAIDAAGVRFLKSTGSAPSWALITATDISSGILPIVRGGTGNNAAPGAGQILRADSGSSYSPATLVGGGTVSISNVAGTITISGSGGTGSPPGGSGTALQYRFDATTFGGVTSSSVSGANVSLGGTLTIASPLGIASGGIGAGSTPAVGQILRADTTSSYVPVNIVGTGTVTVSYAGGTITIAGTGGSSTPPQGVGTELQYRKSDGTAFQPVTNSSVSGADIVLAGYLTTRADTEHALIFHRNVAPSHGQHYGDVIFRSGGGAGTDIGILRCFYTTTDGAGNTIGMGLSDARAVSVSQVASTMAFDGKQVQIQTGGIVMSVGVSGDLLYQGSSFITPLPIAASSTKWLRSNGSAPTWQTITAGSNITLVEISGGIRIDAATGSGGSSQGSATELQYRGGVGTFAALPGSSVGGALPTGGTLQLRVATDMTTAITGTFRVDHTLSGFNSIVNDYGQLFWYNHAHSGSATDGRRGLAIGWNQTASGTSLSYPSTGDAVIQVYAQIGGSLSVSSYTLTGIVVEAFISSVLGTFIGMRVRSPGANVTTPRAIITDSGAGDVIFNYGSDLATTATKGHLFIPATTSTPTGNMIGLVPTGTTALVFDKGANKLWANDGLSTWIDMTAGALPQGGTFLLQYYASSTTFGGIAAGTSGHFLRSGGAGVVAAFAALAATDIQSGTLPIIRGGTNTSSAPTSGSLLIGNSSGGYTVATLTQGTNISIVNGAGGSITISATGGGTPSGTDGNLQYKSGTSFLGLTGSSIVSSAQLRLTTTALSVNLPTFYVDHMLSGAGTIQNDYAQVIWFRHNHSGAISPVTGGRYGLALGWDHQNGGTGSLGTDGDGVFQIYAQNTGGITLTSYRLSGIVVETNFPAQLGTFTGIRIKGSNAAVRRAIMLDYGSGDLVINAGTELTPSATWGFLYIPVMNTTPNTGSINSIVPVGTCAMVFDKANNRIAINYGTGWRFIPTVPPP